MLANALLRSREAIFKPVGTQVHAQQAETPDFVTGRGVLDRFKHWDPAVTGYVLLPDVLRPLSFRAAADGTAITVVVDGSDDALELTRPSIEEFKEQLGAVIDDAQLRDDRASEILTQVTDTWPFWSSIVPISVEKTPATYKLLLLANQLATFVEMRIKHEFACARPCEYSPQVQPMLRTPGHGTYPAGHACEAAVMAGVLSKLVGGSQRIPDLDEQLWRLAIRMGMNRVVAGLHFHMDVVGGLAIGAWIAEYFAACADADCSLPGKLAASLKGKTADDVFAAVTAESPTLFATNTSKLGNQSNADLRKLWARAREEWTWPPKEAE